MRITRLLIGILFIPCTLFSQDWPKIFGTSSYTYLQGGLIESYDKGYMMVCQVEPGPFVPQMYSWIIKTDINGNLLWTKTIFSPSYQISFNGFDQTPDGGFVLTGVTNKLDPGNYDVVFMKFNACGEKQWCNIVSTPGNDDYGVKIKSIPGGYISLVDYFQDWITKRIWLFKLDNNGNILWENLINVSDSLIQNAEGRDILVTSTKDFIVTGDAYEGSPGHTYYLRPLIIKTDSNGNDQWTLPFGTSIGFLGELSKYPSENQSGYIYTTATHFRDSIPFGGPPCFLKISPNGQSAYYRDLILDSIIINPGPASIIGGAATLNLKNNDSLFIASVWQDRNNVQTVGIMKSDTLGVVSKVKVLFQNVLYSTLEESFISFDGKIVAAGDFNIPSSTMNIYLYKFNTNLEFDSTYTVPRFYDSLCPYPIVSDTVSPDDCGIITAIHDPVMEPGFFKLKVYPNPATTMITLEIPKYLTHRNQGNGLTTTTIYHQWNSANLEIYDLFGKIVYSSEIQQTTEELKIDISGWHKGMYVARLVYMKELVASEKFIVE
ncbi:MAG: T9SS type A sorting domain-containing protein [Bacillota bacterium]|nr:T9SS type A sorting domain-containing protein [Bacillota bacterium]